MTHQHTWCSNIRLQNEPESVTEATNNAIVQINLIGVALESRKRQ